MYVASHILYVSSHINQGAGAHIRWAGRTPEEDTVAEDFTRLLTDRPSLTGDAALTVGLLALTRTLHGYGAELLLKLGLYPGQELILMRLYDQDGQSQTALQQSIGLDHSTVSRSIRRMEGAGLVARLPDERDKRAWVVSLTAEGRALGPRVAEVWATLESALADVLTDSERAGLLPTVEALERSLATRRRRD
jgi:MarR family transcriptional regulator, organic hydroperoxide resistance regulator